MTPTITKCPNCGSDLEEGKAEGGILVCSGCSMAVDPQYPDGQTMASAAVTPSSVKASPELGPPQSDEEPEIAVPDPSPIDLPWVAPTSAPQTQNVGEAVESPPTVPAPTPTFTPPPAGGTGNET